MHRRRGWQEADTSLSMQVRYRSRSILIATGSEVSLALSAHEQLTKAGIGSRVVSMPSWELFDREPQHYRDDVLPPAVQARIAIEAASPFGWERYVGNDGAIIGMKSFGASAPGAVLMREFGFTPEHVVEIVMRVLERCRSSPDLSATGVGHPPRPVAAGVTTAER